MVGPTTPDGWFLQLCGLSRWSGMWEGSSSLALEISDRIRCKRAPSHRIVHQVKYTLSATGRIRRRMLYSPAFSGGPRGAGWKRGASLLNTLYELCPPRVRGLGQPEFASLAHGCDSGHALGGSAPERTSLGPPSILEEV
jgi:hypothetical protein